jgi:predicted MFS family arabinose efflux permease
MSFSVVNVAMNVEADRIEAALGRRIMSRCHGYWSLGFLATALVGVAATWTGMSAQAHLGLIVPIVILGVVIAVLPLSESQARRHSGASQKSVVTWPSLASLGIVCFGLLGSVVQSGTQNWSVIYMRQSFEMPDWMDALTIPAFLVALTFGRLSGDRWLDRWGALKLGGALFAAALLGVLIVILSPSYWLALMGFAFMGLGVSIIFPMMVTAAAALGDRAASANVATVTMSTGIGVLIVAPIMGYVADTFSVRIAFAALLPVYLLALLSLHHIVPKNSETAR